MAKTMQKKEIIEGFERLVNEGFMLSPESIGVLKYAVMNFKKDPRDITIAECKEIMNDLEEETGYNLVALLKQIDEAKEGIEEVEVEEDEEPEQIVVDLNEVKDKVKVLPKKPEVKAENSNKKTLKTKAKPEAEEVEEAEEEEKPTKEAKAPKKEEKTPSKLKAMVSETLEAFPEELYSETLKGTLKLRNDITNIEELAEAINDRQEDLVITTFWTKKLLKQYATGYDPYNINPQRPKEFPDNLDIIEITHASNLVVTGISIYSNVPQIILPGDLEICDNNIRYANGCELQIYEVIEDSEEVTE